MKTITNNLLKKEIKKYNIFLIITTILLITSLTFIGIYFLELNKDHKNSIYLNTIIIDMDNQTGLTANLKVAQIPYSFAKYSDDPNNAYYIITDNEFYYIAYMSNSDYKKLNHESIKNKPITIYGKTVYTKEEIRNLALETYNEGLNEEDKISKDDFNDYFGGVYIDITNNANTYNFFLTIGITFLICSFITFIIFIIFKIKSNKLLKSINDKDFNKITKELNEKEAIYYKKGHLILSKNYLITFIKSIKIINYKDIVWIYESAIRQVAFTIVRTISILTTEGKTINIAEITGMNKKNEQIISDIITNVSNKNKNILTGYSTANKKKAKETIKELKKEN